MRQFYLVNSEGQRYQLQNDRTTAFLWQPSGLGFSYNYNYRESDGFFFETNKAIGQTAKTGTLLFHGADPYTQYKAFMDFITGSSGLRLAYAPKSNWYYVDIDIESVEKSEIEEDGTLQCSIVMMPKTPLYLPKEINIDLSGDLGDSIKQYDYTYDYVYSNTAVAGERVIDPLPAQMDSGLEILIPGVISAPVISFYVNDELIGRIDLSSISIQEDEYVRYSSVPLTAGVYFYSDGEESEITEQIGLSATVPTFFLLPPNVPIKVIMSADTITGTSASLKIYEYFMSV